MILYTMQENNTNGVHTADSNQGNVYKSVTTHTQAMNRII